MITIPNQLYTLDLITQQLQPINDKQRKAFNKFKEILEESIEPHNFLFVYRGEKKDILEDRLNSQNIDDLYHRFFCVGNKGKYFIKSNSFERYLNDINDVSDRVFRTIFDSINHIQNDNNATDEVKKYFSNKNNKTLFIEKTSLLNDTVKLRVRDYYFSYLHIMEKDNNLSSFFVSTSKDIEVAESYAGDEKNNQIIIYYFIPKPYIDQAIYCKNEPTLKQYCQDNQLPVYNVLYQEEDEISVKGALFPHYILGVSTFIDEENIFIVNPYLYQTNFNKDNFIKEGFVINKNCFDKTILTTDYNGIRRYENNHFEEIIN